LVGKSHPSSIALSLSSQNALQEFLTFLSCAQLYIFRLNPKPTTTTQGVVTKITLFSGFCKKRIKKHLAGSNAVELGLSGTKKARRLCQGLRSQECGGL
jgi:hypothetical protein